MADLNKNALAKDSDTGFKGNRYDPWEDKFKSHYRPSSSERANKEALPAYTKDAAA